MCYCVEAYLWNPDLRLYEFPFKSETVKRAVGQIFKWNSYSEQVICFNKDFDFKNYNFFAKRSSWLRKTENLTIRLVGNQLHAPHYKNSPRLTPEIQPRIWKKDVQKINIVKVTCWKVNKDFTDTIKYNIDNKLFGNVHYLL